MRAIALLVSVFALSIVSGACTTETVAAPKSAKAKKKSKPTKESQAGEHDDGETADEEQAGGTPVVPEGDVISADATWATGQAFAKNATIGAGTTVTISPGAAVTISGADVAITVKGTLKISAAANHAKITGTGWQGIILAEGGKLEADGLEMTGAKAGIWTQTGNGPSTFKNGVLDAASPFKMEAGSNLTIDRSKIVGKDSSAIAGNFTANYMDYDKGTNSGLILNDAEGSMTIKNSTLHGGGGGDYVISNQGKLVSVTRSSVSGSHCGFHFSGSGAAAGTTAFLLDGVDVRNNGVGGMFYNSGAGPNEIKNTTFSANPEGDITLGSNANGPIKVTNTFGKTPTEANITEVDPRTAPLPPTEVGPIPE